MTSGLVVCAVDSSQAGRTVLEAAKATGAPVLLVHVTDHGLDGDVPAFRADAGTNEQLLCRGPTRKGLLRVASARHAALIVVGTRGRLWRSVARYVVQRAECPVMVVGPHADPHAPVALSSTFDRRLVRESPAPVLIPPDG